MAFNSGGDFKSLYGSPILSSHNFLNNNIGGGGFLFDNHPRNRDWSRSSNLKNYSGGDSYLGSNYNNASRLGGLNFDRFNGQSDRFSSNNYSNGFSAPNYPNNGYSGSYLPRDGLLNGNMKSDSLFKSDSQFEVPSYLKSVDTYTPNRVNYNAGNLSNNHCTPTRSLNAGNRPNGFAGASNQNYNFHASKFNSSSSNYDAGGSNLLRSSLNDDWKRNNYLKVSNSPNLKFSSHFFPNNSRVLAERGRNYSEMNDYLHYAKNRDKLDKIGRNLNSLSPPGARNFDSKHSGNYGSNFSSSNALDNLDNFDSVLNGNFNSESYVNSNSRLFNRPDSYSRPNGQDVYGRLRGSDTYRKFDDSDTYNRYKPSESYGTFNRPDAFSRFSGTQPFGRYNAPEYLDKFTGLDKYNRSNPLDSSLNNSYVSSINRYVDAQETASPSFAFNSDLADLNIDDLYDKVKEQKQQLLKLKSDFH
ncbi:hypothetical protein MACK_002552 [Theileria orientalis]|uniref:Uncharacterized protein n=1 Tax=Theileria orientalis TaxID=68886 RepID=A0A976QTR0_THEOR|nr:hypothetical protein MACK_002552 [Theileria orientalis]